MIYLDSNASHPLLPSVKRDLAEFLESPFAGNASSTHSAGRRAKKYQIQLRETFEDFFAGQIKAEDIYISSGSTESLNLLIRGWARICDPKNSVALSFSVEHSAILSTLEDLAPISTRIFPVDSNGQIPEDYVLREIEALAENSKSEFLLVMQWGNNETGICYEVESFLQKIRAQWNHSRLRIVLDLSQALGKIPTHELVKVLPLADAAVFSGHKIGAPSGIGALWKRSDWKLPALITGGRQERGLRAGSENILGIVGFTAALKAWMHDGDRYREHLWELRRILLKAIWGKGNLKIHSLFEERLSLPNTVHFSIESFKADSLLARLDLEGISVSSGSACHAGVLLPSHVLLAMGCREDEAKSALRVSLGVHNSREDLEFFVAALERLTESR